MDLPAEINVCLTEPAHVATGTDASVNGDRIVLNLAAPLTVAADWVSILGGGALTLLIWRVCGGLVDPNHTSMLISFCLLFGVGFVLLGMSQNLYRRSHSLLRVLESSSVLRVSLGSLVLSFVGIYLTIRTRPSALLICSWFITTASILLLRQFSWPLITRFRPAGTRGRRALIVGAGPEARRIFSYLVHSADHAFEPIGFLDESCPSADRVIYSHGYQFKEHARVYGGTLHDGLLATLKITDVFFADPSMSSSRRAEIAAVASALGIRISEVGPVHPGGRRAPSVLHNMDGLVVHSFSSDRSVGFRFYEAVKRTMDTVLAFWIVVVTLPLWIAVALWIKTTSSGPVFFKQERIGRHGKPFAIYKFRTMYTTAPKYGRSPESSEDPRITPAGRFLRKTSLDELPQLLNVLEGDMALVGPRPEMPYVVAKYTEYEMQRLSVLPGITGFWQLSADRKFVIHESLEYDLYYIENRGFFLDLAVLLHTLVFAMKGV